MEFTRGRHLMYDDDDDEDNGVIYAERNKLRLRGRRSSRRRARGL